PGRGDGRRDARHAGLRRAARDGDPARGARARRAGRRPRARAGHARAARRPRRQRALPERGGVGDVRAVRRALDRGAARRSARPHREPAPGRSALRGALALRRRALHAARVPAGLRGLAAGPADGGGAMSARTPVLLHMTAPSREDFDVPYHDLGPRGEPPGLALVAGLHGNELNGVFVLARLASFLRQVAEGRRPGAELLGRVVVIPAVNVLGLNVRRRAWPFDGTDVNRMFPGYDAGETTQRIAAAVLAATEGA